MSDDLWTVGDLETYFKACGKTVYRWLNSGQIPGAFKVGGNWYVHKQTFFDGIRAKAAQKVKPVDSRNRHGL